MKIVLNYFPMLRKKALIVAIFAVIALGLTGSSLLALRGDDLGLPSDTTINRMASPETYSNLPVGRVFLYEKDDARGVAVLIPQTHRNPGTKASDRVNDSAELAQEQIYSILAYLQGQFGVNLIMAEGDLYGKVADKKIDRIARLIDARDDFSDGVSALLSEARKQKINSPVTNTFFESAEGFIAEVDREVILIGAPYKLKAEGREITLYGSENQSTLEEGADIVRKYTYLNDRIAQIGVPAYSVSLLNFGSSFLSGARTAAMPYGQAGFPASGQFLETGFAFFEIIAKFTGGQRLSEILAASKEAYYNVQKLREEKGASVLSTSAAKRSDNPYQYVNDLQTLQEMLADIEKQMEEVVLIRRTEETAQNFARALEEENAVIGVLQYGALHEEGLVQELNKQGLTVVVVTPREVLERSRS